MYFIIFSLSFQYGAKIKRICFYLATPQSTLSTAPLYGSLICLSLRRGAQRTEWWFRTGQHLDVTFQHYHGRPMVAPTTVFHLCSPFSLATSVDFVDSSPLWEPYMPLLEERCPKGGMVVSYRTMTSTPISSPPPQSTSSTAPLYGSLICLSLRRGGTQCRSGGFVWNGTLDVTFQQYRERPMVAPTTVFHLCSPFSLAPPQSTLSTAPLYGR